MASTKGAASGADFDQTVRRRNVPSTTPNGGLVDRVEIDEKKTQVKKVRVRNLHCLRKPYQEYSRTIGVTCSLQSQQSVLQFLDEWEYIIAPLIFTILAFFTRLYKIGLSPIVTWDEAQ